MVKLTINGLPVAVEDGTTIMEAAKAAGISIPHLCYLKGINDIGACRICSVEVEGELSLVPSCNTAVREGMKVTTNSARVPHQSDADHVAARRTLFPLRSKRNLPAAEADQRLRFL